MNAHPYDRHISNGSVARLIIRLSNSKFRKAFRAISVIAGCDIRIRVPRTTYFPHPLGIVISGATSLGEYVVIGQQVTLGNKNGVVAAPTIGDFVYIGAGAKVLGGVSIGKGAIIGANAVVTRDVLPGQCVVGSNRVIELSKDSYWKGPEMSQPDPAGSNK